MSEDRKLVGSPERIWLYRGIHHHFDVSFGIPSNHHYAEYVTVESLASAQRELAEMKGYARLSTDHCERLYAENAALLERLREKSPHATDDDIRAWAGRHSYGLPYIEELRAMFEDAQSWRPDDAALTTTAQGET